MFGLRKTTFFKKKLKGVRVERSKLPPGLQTRRGPIRHVVSSRMSEYQEFRIAASRVPYFRWVVGHGEITPVEKTVPPNTWIIF